VPTSAPAKAELHQGAKILSAGINRVELFDVGDDFGNLRREQAAFVIGDFQMSELRNLFNVGFSDGHDFLF
jgi:hypothetical protein